MGSEEETAAILGYPHTQPRRVLMLLACMPAILLPSIYAKAAIVWEQYTNALNRILDYQFIFNNHSIFQYQLKLQMPITAVMKIINCITTGLQSKLISINNKWSITKLLHLVNSEIELSIDSTKHIQNLLAGGNSLISQE